MGIMGDPTMMGYRNPEQRKEKLVEHRLVLYDRILEILDQISVIEYELGNM
jgi:hypothetical protein